MKKPIKKVAAWLLVTILMLQNTMLTAKGADYGTDETVRTPGIYRDGRYLKDQDTVREQDVLEWVTEVSFSGESEEIEIPEGLLYFSKARSLITLAGPDGTVRAKTIAFEKKNRTMSVGDTLELSVKKNPITAVDKIVYVVSKNGVLSLENGVLSLENGVITAEKPGTAYVKATTKSGLTAKCKIVVK